MGDGLLCPVFGFEREFLRWVGLEFEVAGCFFFTDVLMGAVMQLRDKRMFAMEV